MTNQERYKTPEERAEAFSMFCISRKCADCACVKQGKKGISLCEFKWLALEAEKKKESLLPCPFCGGEAELVVNHPITTKGAYVKCTRCWTFVTGFNTEYAAIAAWNRRVK